MSVVKQNRWKTRSDRNWISKFVKKRIPIVSWLPKYDSEKFLNDAIAGITVGLTVMPQGLAYATLAGLEPQVKLRNMNFELINFVSD